MMAVRKTDRCKRKSETDLGEKDKKNKQDWGIKKCVRKRHTVRLSWLNRLREREKCVCVCACVSRKT